MVARCWLEVWDYGLENRLTAGYVNDNGPLNTIFDQLCAFARFENWDRVFLCHPMKFRTDRTTYVYTRPTRRVVNINEAMLDVENNESWILDTNRNLMLVIELRAPRAQQSSRKKEEQLRSEQEIIWEQDRKKAVELQAEQEMKQQYDGGSNGKFSQSTNSIFNFSGLPLGFQENKYFVNNGSRSD